MATHALEAARLALSLTCAQRLMVAQTRLDGDCDQRTATALASRNLFTHASGAYITVRYGTSHVVPGVRSRTELGARVARLLWGQWHSRPLIVAIVAAEPAA